MTWAKYAMNIAEVVALKSKDPWKKVGAVILRNDNSIASVGYNGFPAKMEEDWTDRNRRRNYVVHAEQNALRYIRPGECYLLASTLLPCKDCLRIIAGYGIKKVYYKEVYANDDSALTLAKDFGIFLGKISS